MVLLRLLLAGLALLLSVNLEPRMVACFDGRFRGLLRTLFFSTGALAGPSRAEFPFTSLFVLVLATSFGMAPGRLLEDAIVLTSAVVLALESSLEISVFPSVFGTCLVDSVFLSTARDILDSGVLLPELTKALFGGIRIGVWEICESAVPAGDIPNGFARLTIGGIGSCMFGE